MPEAPDIATAWRCLLERTEGRQGDPLVVQAAYEQPRLRALFPFPSHGCLKFMRLAPPPWPFDLGEEELPFIVSSNPGYKVYATRYERLLGETRTPEEAAALLVANLPDGVGPPVGG
ncbi:DUF6193 family natural product biosynthesis protein [Streptacidiphilus sp. N1-10]|uniref:DUF6193 family natural product biosynthesis protein n=1 Tax=Streptacidiphilus jeojiensis TaxID=3229225 RepID=A0ABV6XUK1_9ACTN